MLKSCHDHSTQSDNDSLLHKTNVSLSSLSSEKIDDNGDDASSVTLPSTFADECSSSSSPYGTCSLDVDLQERIRRYGERHVMTGPAYNHLGNFYFRQGQFDWACRYYHFAAYECQVGAHTADALANLGTVYWTKGDSGAAQIALMHALEAYAHLPDPDRFLVANVHHQLGLVHSLHGDYHAALCALNQALVLREGGEEYDDKDVQVDNNEKDELCYNEAAPMIAKTMDAMGQVSCLAHDYHGAVRWYEHSLRQFWTIRTLQHLAQTYLRLGDHLEDALSAYHDILREQRKEACSPDMQDLMQSDDSFMVRREVAINLGQTLLSLQNVYQEMGRADDATVCHDELLKLLQQEGIELRELEEEN